MGGARNGNPGTPRVEREEVRSETHEYMDPDEEGPSKGLTKRMNEQTGRPEYLCECFDIWHDPADKEKTVSNVKAYFYNKERDEWDRRGREAGHPEQRDEQEGGTHKQGGVGNPRVGTPTTGN